MEMELFLYPWRTCLIFACVLGCYVASTVLLGPKPFGGHHHCWWTAAQRYGEQWRNQFWPSLEESVRKCHLECGNRCEQPHCLMSLDSTHKLQNFGGKNMVNITRLKPTISQLPNPALDR